MSNYCIQKLYIILVKQDGGPARICSSLSFGSPSVALVKKNVFKNLGFSKTKSSETENLINRFIYKQVVTAFSVQNRYCLSPTFSLKFFLNLIQKLTFVEIIFFTSFKETSDQKCVISLQKRYNCLTLNALHKLLKTVEWNFQLSHHSKVR